MRTATERKGPNGCWIAPLPIIGGERRTYRGVAQPFAAHAHDHYVIGRVAEGERVLELSGGSAQDRMDSGIMPLFGDLLALAAALVWALYSLLVRRIADLGYETVASTKRTFLWGIALILPATLAFGGPYPDPNMLGQPLPLINLLFLGLIASAACFVTWGIAVKRLGTTTATTYIYLVPAITAVSSILLLGEPFTLPVVAGLAMTVAGLLLSGGQETCEHELSH